MTLRAARGVYVEHASRIAGNLWMGGVPDEWLPSEFEYVLNLYPEGRYKRLSGVVVKRVRMKDSDEIPEGLEGLADWASRSASSGPTLVHCRTGLNRSALVVGLALIRDGMDPEAAIARMREKRSPAVLSNTAFEKWLLDQRTPE